MIKEKDSIKDLKYQAMNTKSLMDSLNKAYIGLSTDELIRLALEGRKLEDKPLEESE